MRNKEAAVACASECTVCGISQGLLPVERMHCGSWCAVSGTDAHLLLNLDGVRVDADDERGDGGEQIAEDQSRDELDKEGGEALRVVNRNEVAVSDGREGGECPVD